MERRTTAAGVLALTGLALVGCGDGTSVGAADGPPEVPTTHRALAAAVIDHLGQRPVAAAALTTKDGVRRRDWGVEVAFARPGSDPTHVSLYLTRDLAAWTGTDCDGEENENASGCVERTVHGVPVRVSWQAEAPEEDPGVITVVARHRDRVVAAGASGPHVPRRLEGSRLQAMADRMADLVLDPAVGFTTSRAYDDAGTALPDRVWLDWYGQGNGSPSPGPGTQHQD